MMFSLSKLLCNLTLNSRQGDRFLFAIPLIGSHLTNDFTNICRLLELTLRSAHNQTDKHFDICIACNDIPEVSDTLLKNVHLVLMDKISKEEVLENPWVDYKAKLSRLRYFATIHDYSYFFQLDADDLVDCDLVKIVRKLKNPNGYVINKGYLLINDKFYPFPNENGSNKSFDQICGTSIVVTLDTGLSVDEKQNYLSDILNKGHNRAAAAFGNVGRPAALLDYHAAVYRINHGSNLYMQVDNKRQEWVNSIIRNYQFVSIEGNANLKKRFGLPVR